VHDLLGPPAKLQPLPHVPPYELPPDVEAREDLRDLENALKALVPEAQIVALGTRLVVSGPRQAPLLAKLALDALRHPAMPKRVSELQAEPGPLRIIMPNELADPLVAHWRAKFTSQVTFHVSSQTSDAPEEAVIVSVSGASFYDLVANTTLQLEFPFVCVAPGEEGEFASIRGRKPGRF
jgi:hypothetical protein